MSDIAISVENVSKSYLVGHNLAKAKRDDTLRDVIARHAHNLARKTRDMIQGRAIVQGDEVEEFWALKDVSFEIKHGDRVGIIGRNGAGKSTLLKILSRITEPTNGRIKINGRVASLLEVGTGFHPELSGRENIFLNGAILGMSRREIQSKFDEIVAFAEVEKFLDTPVKRYSSGMYVRLAFAVAAHLEPEILIVDEVLAVGDVQFQKKCLGKMQDISSKGRTILFVSHNMAAIEQLTQKALHLQSGCLTIAGNTADVIACYLGASGKENTVVFNVENNIRRYLGNQKAHFIQFRFNRQSPIFYANENLEFVACVRANENINNVRFSMTIFCNDGTPVGSCFGAPFTHMNANQISEFKVVLLLPRLAPGSYNCGISVGQGDHTTGHIDFDVVHDTLSFEIRPPEGDEGTISNWARGWGQIIFQPLEQTILC
jgi:lipopolysaccharide transport system ATP-binding protein